MILLDTNAVLWLLTQHRRSKPLLKADRRLFLSPVSLLELQYLIEVGRLSELPGKSVRELVKDPRWKLDSPASDRLFDSALGLGWTRDPFDRLLAAHATHRRWRLATGDQHLIENLPEARILPL